MPDEVPNRYLIRDAQGRVLAVTKEGEAWARRHGLQVPPAPQGESPDGGA